MIIPAEENREKPPPFRPFDLTAIFLSDFQDTILDVKLRLLDVLGSDAPMKAGIKYIYLRIELQGNGTLKKRSLKRQRRQQPISKNAGLRVAASAKFCGKYLAAMLLFSKAQSVWSHFF